MNEQLASVIGGLLPPWRNTVCNLTGGRGHMLAGLVNKSTRHLLVVEVQPTTNVKIEMESPPRWSRITADVTDVYPVLKTVDFRCDYFAISPPETTWTKSKLSSLAHSELPTVQNAFKRSPEVIDSLAATVMMALDLMTNRGEAVLVAKDAHVERVLFHPDSPYRALAAHAWYRFVLPGTALGDDEPAVSVVYLAASHHIGCRETIRDLSSIERMKLHINSRQVMRHLYRTGVYNQHEPQQEQTTAVTFDAAKDEINQRKKGDKRDDYNITVDEDGLIQVHISQFHNAQVLRRRIDVRKIAELKSLAGKRPADLVMQQSTRALLKECIESGLWRVHPALPAAIELAVHEYESVRAPLYPLNPTQRLGYLDEEKMIRCRADMVSPKGKVMFKAGERYSVTTTRVMVERYTSKPNMSGGVDEILLNGQELLIYIKDATGSERSFIDRRHLSDEVNVTTVTNTTKVPVDYDLQTLLEHFDIPDVPDVAITHSETYESNRSLMGKINAFINEHIDPNFKFKNFQTEDYSRAAVHDGLVLAHDTGLGKSIAAICYSLLKCGVDWPQSIAKRGLYPRRPVLLVAPENLHDQLLREWKNRFGLEAVKLDCQDTYLKIKKRGPLAGWFITSYTQLGLNKVKEMLDPADLGTELPAAREGEEPRRVYSPDEVARLMHFYGVTIDDARAGDQTMPIVDRALDLCFARFRNFANGVGEKKGRIKCVFSPSLADLCGHEFEAVVIDEGTRIKGEDTIIGQAVRWLDPRCRLVLTATPVKNRLKDLFWLLHWAAGGEEQAHARFPYDNNSKEQARFVGEFHVCERNLTKEEEKEVTSKRSVRKPRGKPGVEVCNIHRLWKLIAPLVLRRRKADISEEIVKRTKHIIRVPIGEKQYEVYRYHLMGEYLDKNGDKAIGAKLQALRAASSAPASESLTKLPSEQELAGNVMFRSDTDYIPKMAAALNVFEQRMRMGEQIVLFSALHEPLDAMGKRLASAGVPFDILDGRKSGAFRGKASAAFQRGLPQAKPILLCGMRSMSEGNNWPRSNNVIIFTLDWAWDAYAQAIDRCYRLNSEKDVNIYPIIASGTMDPKMDAMLDDKGQASELVIDGRLIGEDAKELDLSELLKIAVEEFRGAETYPEWRLEREWPDLRAKLNDAWRVCQMATRQAAAIKQAPRLLIHMAR